MNADIILIIYFTLISKRKKVKRSTLAMRAGVNVRMIDQGSSELNIIVGVDNENYERTVSAVYREFFGFKI